MKLDWCAYRFISSWTHFCIFFFFFLATMSLWSGLKLYLELQKNSLQVLLARKVYYFFFIFFFFIFTHSELITWRRSGMVGQVGRYLHSTSDDLENETPKINSSFKWDLFLNVCFSLFAPTFTRYSFTEPLWRRHHPPDYKKLYHQMILKLLL